MRFLISCVLFCMAPAVGQEATISDSDADDILAPYRAEAIGLWEADIQKLEVRDAAEDDPADAILFIGSSSIRLWNTIATDMAPYRVIRRGYGGAKYSDVAVFAERLLRPHRYRALVVFVGNDVSGQPDDHSPQQVEQLIRYILGVSRKHEPDAPVLLIEVTPTESRLAVWPQTRRVNERLREIAFTTPNVFFVATAEHYLDPNGHPQSELFVADKLHLNKAGYALWSKLIRRRLDEVLRTTEKFRTTGAPRAAVLE